MFKIGRELRGHVSNDSDTLQDFRDLSGLEIVDNNLHFGLKSLCISDAGSKVIQIFKLDKLSNKTDEEFLNFFNSWVLFTKEGWLDLSK